jgi:formylmethanofuran dehydrogenase subunit C
VSALTLELTGAPDQRLDLSPLTPALLAGLKPKEIEALPIGTTRARLVVGDLFKLKGKDAGTLRLIGTDSRCDRIGHKLDQGEILVDGDAGAYLGAAMRAGKITVTGGAGVAAASGMAGGTLAIGGDAGERAGGMPVGETFGMRGGLLTIGGDAGRMLGERMRRGLILVNGKAAEYAGARMIAGTILIKGKVGAFAGFGLRRGTLILTHEPKDLMPTFGDSGVLDFTYLRLLERQLRVSGSAVKLGYRARRLMGDMAVLGKGEMLILT